MICDTIGLHSIGLMLETEVGGWALVCVFMETNCPEQSKGGEPFWVAIRFATELEVEGGK